MERPRKGDHYRSLRDLDVRGIIAFGAPYSHGFSGRLPAGEYVHVDQDPPEWARGVYLVPIRYEHFEREFVPEHTLANEDYGGYAIGMSFDALAGSFERVSPDDVFGAGVGS